MRITLRVMRVIAGNIPSRIYIFALPYFLWGDIQLPAITRITRRLQTSAQRPMTAAPCAGYGDHPSQVVGHCWNGSFLGTCICGSYDARKSASGWVQNEVKQRLNEVKT